MNNEEGNKCQSGAARKIMMKARQRKGGCIQSRLWERTEPAGAQRKQQPESCCLPSLAQISSSPSFKSTACHEHSPPPFRPRCGWCSARPCDEREKPWEMFNNLPHTSFIVYCVRAYQQRAGLTNTVSLRITLTMYCNRSSAALGSAGFDSAAFTYDNVDQHLRPPGPAQHDLSKPLETPVSS